MEGGGGRGNTGGGGFTVCSVASSGRQPDSESSFADMRASFDRNTSRAVEEPSRHSPFSPIGTYLLDVPPLPSPDLSELLENVSHFQQTGPHEEHLVSARQTSDSPTRLVPRRRLPSPPPPPPPPAPRFQARARVERTTTGWRAGHEHIDPELFAPGPYRNTLQSLTRRRDASPPASRPPTIPPLPFESNMDGNYLLLGDIGITLRLVGEEGWRQGQIITIEHLLHEGVGRCPESALKLFIGGSLSCICSVAVDNQCLLSNRGRSYQLLVQLHIFESTA
jgi:hypothetical protein